MKRWTFIRGNRMEYFIYLVLLSSLLTLIFGSVIYYYTSDKLVQEAIQNNNNTLQLLRNAQETVLNEVDKSLESIFFDSAYSSFNDYYQSQDITMMMNVQEKMDNIVFFNKYIHSLYLVYPDYNRVLGDQTGVQKTEEFIDRNFITEMLQTPYRRGEVVTRKLKGAWDAEAQDVITFVKTIPLVSQSPTAYLVVNVKAAYLLDTLNMINTDDNARIMVMDHTGRLIAEKTGQAAVDYPNLSDRLSEGDLADNGYQIIGTRTSGTLVSYVTSNHHDWLFLYTIPMSVVTGSSRLWGQTLIILCLSITVLGILGSYVLSGRLLTPIRRMLSLVRSENSLTESSSSSFKETSQLEMNIHSILHRNRNMEELLQSYEGDIRKRFLQGLLQGKQEADDKKLIETFRYYGHEADAEGRYTVLLVSMDQYAKFCKEHTEKERNTFFLELAQIMEQEIMPDSTGFVLELDSGEIAAVLHHKHEMLQEESERLAHEAAKRLHVLIGAASDRTYTFTIGVSKSKQGLGEISRAYYEAQNAVHDRIIFGSNSVNLYNLEQTKSEVVLYPYAIEKKILVALKSGDETNTRHALHEFGLYIQNMAPQDFGIVKYYFFQLYSTSLKYAFEINPDLVSKLEFANNTELMEMDTLPDVLGYLDQFYGKIFQYLSTKRSSKNRELSESICRYIQSRPNEDLSQERLGELFHVSSSHLRKIFKEETGQTLKDFILNIRMETAKGLLGNSEIKVADIAEKVGYLSSQSFTRAFRQVTGVTPGEFRDSCLLEKAQDNSSLPE